MEGEDGLDEVNDHGGICSSSGTLPSRFPINAPFHSLLRCAASSRLSGRPSCGLQGRFMDMCDSWEIDLGPAALRYALICFVQKAVGSRSAAQEWVDSGR